MFNKVVQFYPEMYGGRPGSIASFSFRLLLSELPMHCGKPKDSLTRLYSMKSTIKQVLIVVMFMCVLLKLSELAGALEVTSHVKNELSFLFEFFWFYSVTL